MVYQVHAWDHRIKNMMLIFKLGITKSRLTLELPIDCRVAFRCFNKRQKKVRRKLFSKFVASIARS